MSESVRFEPNTPGEHVWAVVYAMWMLDQDQRFLGRMKGIPTHQQEAVGAANLARSEYLKMLNAERQRTPRQRSQIRG